MDNIFPERKRFRDFSSFTIYKDILGWHGDINIYIEYRMQWLEGCNNHDARLEKTTAVMYASCIKHVNIQSKY